jgi:D-alanyl-D-alanine carboxypeptidase
MEVKMNQSIEKLLQKTESKQGIFPFQVLVFSESKGIRIEYPQKSADILFHIASVGKLISTVYCLRLVEQGYLNLDDSIAKYLDVKMLDGLFKSVPEKISVKDCLTHRTGAADYFEGKDKDGVKFIDLVLKHPDQEWSRSRILEFVRTQLKPVAECGEKFNYGDTAFMLVLMIIEKIKDKPIHLLLEEEMFKPFGLFDTQSMIYLYSNEFAKYPKSIYLGKTDAKSFRSLNCDQADGGIVSTPNDLLKFQTLLHSGQLINTYHLNLMQEWQGVFRAGIHYGLGMMQIRFEEFFFLMRNFPRLIGHIGILSTHCFYDPKNDIHFIMNFGSNDKMTQSFVFLSNLVGTLKKEKII